MRVYAGTSGWSYRHWWGAFYPADLPARRALSYYAEHFNAVEINATFYRVFRDATFQRWASQVPEGFRFVLKFPRQVTHYSRLQDLSTARAFCRQARLPGAEALSAQGLPVTR